MRRWPKLRPRAEVTELDPVINPRTHVIPAAGWSSPVARQAHNLKAAGSNPAPATKTKYTFFVYNFIMLIVAFVLTDFDASVAYPIHRLRFILLSTFL